MFCVQGIGKIKHTIVALCDGFYHSLHSGGIQLTVCSTRSKRTNLKTHTRIPSLLYYTDWIWTAQSSFQQHEVKKGHKLRTKAHALFTEYQVQRQRSTFYHIIGVFIFSSFHGFEIIVKYTTYLGIVYALTESEGFRPGGVMDLFWQQAPSGECGLGVPTTCTCKHLNAFCRATPNSQLFQRLN